LSAGGNRLCAEAPDRTGSWHVSDGRSVSEEDVGQADRLHRAGFGRISGIIKCRDFDRVCSHPYMRISFPERNMDVLGRRQRGVPLGRVYRTEMMRINFSTLGLLAEGMRRIEHNSAREYQAIQSIGRTRAKGIHSSRETV
jgi:hypothetical protein